MQIALLHSVSRYVPWMGRPTSPWYNLSFASNGKVNCGTIRCANWHTLSLHYISSSFYIPSVEAINVAMSGNLEVDVLVPFTSKDTGMDYVRVWNIIYLPASYVGMFLEWYPTHVEAWSHLQGATVDVVYKSGFCLIINWIQVALTWKSRDIQVSPLV